MSLRLWNPRHSACSFAGKLFPPFHYWTTVYRAYLRPCDRIPPISSRASTRTGCELRVNYVSLFFSLIGEKKESILSWRNLSSKIHSFENSDGVVRKKGNRSERGRGDIVSPSRSPPSSATNHHKARYKCSALVLLGYLSNISSSITFSNFFESSSPFPFRYFIIHTVDRSRGKT